MATKRRIAAGKVTPVYDGREVHILNESGYKINVVNVRVDEYARVWMAFELGGRRWYRAPDGSLH